jgi:plasmid stabilization system protein ParE
VTRRLTLRPEADAEVDEAAAWYAAQAPGLGGEFVRAVDAAISAIQRNPSQFPLVHRDAGRAVLRRFPYSIVYRSTAEEIVVLSVFHARRDPADWKARLGG